MSKVFRITLKMYKAFKWDGFDARNVYHFSGRL